MVAPLLPPCLHSAGKRSVELNAFDLLYFFSLLSLPALSDSQHTHSTSCTCLRYSVVAPILTLSIMNSNCPSDDKAVAEYSESTIKGMGEMERVSDRLFKVCVCPSV